ncbi:sulfotransferase [Dokdonella sp.]|uniref:tetratricopeptide repeat-containing sulfotransferase family protein n=1 Tax=Dokdonella sp. TaxID=2291710 RepID=UPI001B1D89B2|nr:sulfotransferase [Dokdonella sp.]MBO9663340.1 sulfotransferase [Dokdonella sp.]
MNAVVETPLPPRCAQLLRRAGHWIEHGEFAAAERALIEARQRTGDHADVLRTEAALLRAGGNAAGAALRLRRALELRPANAPLLIDLGLALREAGDAQSAYAVLSEATQRDPDSPRAWYRFGELLRDGSYAERAEEALARARALAPMHRQTLLLHADILKSLCRDAEAAAEYRELIRLSPHIGEAWHGLTSLATQTLDADELAWLQRLPSEPQLDDEQRIHAGFALGTALERAGRHAEAFAAFVEANHRQRARIDWDAAAFGREVDGCIVPFDGAGATAADEELGHEVLFIVSPPRSGSSLTEQILASHPQVEGAGELPDLAEVLQEESRRRGAPFFDWAGSAGADDWARLGRDYLERTRRRREARPRFVDKALPNWQLIGAIRAMLPGARIVECRRDPLEAAWSCFKHRFPDGSTRYAYEFDELGAFWRDYERAMAHWHRLHPDRIHVLSHAALLADPDGEIRRLLDACALPFDETCLRFHETARPVRTLSSTQVRRPLQRDATYASAYGDLLDPLRSALAGAR